MKKLILLTAILMSGSLALVAQGYDPGKVTRLQDTRRWDKEIPEYQKVLENGEFPAVMEKLADCYRMTGDMEKAEEWYRKSLTSGNNSSTCRLNYARVLQSNGKYMEAKSQFKLYEEISGDYEVGDKYIASCDMAMKVKDDEQRYEIQPVSRLNSRHSDIVALNSQDEIVFATRGKRGDIGSHKSSRRQSNDYDFYRAHKRYDGSFSDIRSVKGKANSRYDDVGAVKMPGSDLVLFTRADAGNTSGRKNIGDNETNEVRIVGARVDGRKWNEVEDLPFNTGDANHNFHPAIHPSGDVIIFASDRPGGYGGVDLYMVKREGGKWSKPMNLGPEVNTESDELFPTFNEQGFLFFASDGHIGYGGLDLYTAEMKDGDWTNATNMGAGINSSKDDFGIVWDKKTSSGYFTSNRNLESGDDIYRFDRKPGLSGQIFDGMTKEPLAGSIIRMKDISGNEKIIISDGAGQFSEAVKENSGFLVTVDAPGFHTWRDTFWTKDIPQGRDLNIDVYLEVEQMFEMNGKTLDAFADENLGDAEISIIHHGAVQNMLHSNAQNGDYRFRLKPGEDYTVIFKKENYIPRVMNLSLSNFRGVEVRTTDVPMERGDYVLVKGTILEDGTEDKAVSHAMISIVNNNTQEVVDSMLSLKNGSFWLAVPWDSLSNYSLIASKDGYFSNSDHIVDRENKEVEMRLSLNQADYGLMTNLKVIYYGYNQSKLDLLSKKDLNEIYFFLQQNPKAKLEIRSHTDARGSKRYNLELSRKRSEAVVKYIQSRRAIPDERFVTWGFGEEYLLNDCGDGKTCSEEDHKLNRRTEIKVLEE